MAILLIKNGDSCVKTGDIIGVFPDDHVFSHLERRSVWIEKGNDPFLFVPVFVLVTVIDRTVDDLLYLLELNPNAFDNDGVEIPGAPIKRYWCETPAEGTPERISLQQNYEITVDNATLQTFLRDRG